MNVRKAKGIVLGILGLQYFDDQSVKYQCKKL